MSLLDLPPELFLHITHDVIDTCGISGAWKLREVCRTFADNITHEIMYRPTTAFLSQYRDRTFFSKSVSRYLAARMHNELDVDPNLIRKVQDMVAWAVSQLGTTTSQQRDDVAFKVCATLEQTVGTSQLVHALVCDHSSCYMQWPAWSKEPLDSHDKLVALTAIGRYDNAADLLTAFSDPASQSLPIRSWLDFAPFLLAFKTDDDLLFNVSLQYLADIASQRGDGSAILSRLTSGHLAPFRMDQAVSQAIRYSNIEGLRALLDFYRKYLPPPERMVYVAWVEIAISGKAGTEAMQCLSLVLTYKPRGKSLVEKHIIRTACNYGSAAVVQEVLKHANKGINTGTIFTLPIFIAVRSGRLAAINGVIDAGADPKILADSNMPSVKKKRVTPLESAMHRNSPEMVNVLLKRGGGPIPHVSERTTHRQTYNFLRQKVFEESNVWVPQLRIFKRLTEEQRRAIKH